MLAPLPLDLDRRLGNTRRNSGRKVAPLPETFRRRVIMRIVHGLALRAGAQVRVHVRAARTVRFAVHAPRQCSHVGSQVFSLLVC
jgi:hypothetical protein